MATIIIVVLAFWAGFWAKGIVERYAAERTAEREERRRIRQEDDESTRYHLIAWAFGNSDVKNAPPITPPMNREEVIKTLRKREGAIKLLEALLDNPRCAEQEYARFISWFDLTGGERELRDALPMYLLGIWADFNHPQRGKDELKLLMDNFNLTEQQAQAAIDRYYDLLP